MTKQNTQYHYVYRISNLIENKHYYGLRSSSIHPENDLGKIYYSSSTNKQFITDQKNNKANYKYKIIKIFETREEAAHIEIKLHKRLNVAFNERFYNLSNASSLNRGLINTYKQWENYTPEIKAKVLLKISESNKIYYSNLTIEEKFEKMRPLENWKNNNPELVKANNLKAAEKRKGKNNGFAKQINIFDKDGNLKFECFGNFGNTCKEYGIPHQNLKISLTRNGEPIYNSTYGKSIAKKFGKEEFIGWFAKYKNKDENGK